MGAHLTDVILPDSRVLTAQLPAHVPAGAVQVLVLFDDRVSNPQG